MSAVLYLGTSEGVVTLCRDNGSPWRVEHHGLRDWHVTNVAVVDGQPNRVLAATRGDGVWLSEDSGKSWTKPCYGKPGPGKTHCLALDPETPGRVYVGGEPIEMFVSDDLGRSWDRLGSVRELPWVAEIDYPVPTVEPHVRDIAIAPHDPRTIYAALQVGHMIKSTDGGATWQRLDRNLDADVHTIALDPTDPQTIVVATGGHDARAGRAQGRALYRSRDGGASWSPIGTNFSEEYSVPLVRHPSNPRVMYSALADGPPPFWGRRPTGADSLIVRTTDGGDTWEKVPVDLPDFTRAFATALAIATDAPDQVYAGLCTGELLFSDDGGDSWTKLDVRVPEISDMQYVAV